MVGNQRSIEFGSRCGRVWLDMQHDAPKNWGERVCETMGIKHQEMIIDVIKNPCRPIAKQKYNIIVTW